jgi:hypothetical protein
VVVWSRRALATSDSSLKSSGAELESTPVVIRTTKITTRTFSVPSNVTSDERKRLQDFYGRNFRWPQPGDGEIYELLRHVEKESDKALVRAPRQPGESGDSVNWRRGRAALRLLRRRREAISGVVPVARRSHEVVRRSREGSPRRRRRGDATGRQGDSGDRPPPPPSSKLVRPGQPPWRGAAGA